MFRQETVPVDGNKEHIAYFSMEVAISHNIPTYSGGLGVLAGDLLKSFADMNVPMIGVTLLNEKGYFHQKIDDDGNQIEESVEWNVHDALVKLPNEVTVTIDSRTVKIQAWKLTIQGQSGHTIPLIFLDSNVEGNSDFDKTLTSHLYGGDRYYRLCQEVILGIAGVRMMESIGYSNIKKYHMNEGHAALLTIELLKRTFKDADCEENCFDKNAVKEKCVFTTHTPVAAGHDRFEVDTFRQVLGDFFPEFIYEHVIEEGQVSMTHIAMYLSKYINGVAKRHGEVSREMFPEYQIDSITNGIHPPTWVSLSFLNLFNKHIPGWSLDPFSLRYALSIAKEEVWDAHYESKKELIQYINKKTDANFHPDRFTIGFARRFTGYKRPNLILDDLERLQQVAENVGDIQVVFAGKAHASDTQGKEIIKQVIHTAREINNQGGKLKLIFLPQYDMRLAKLLVSGVDVWLNTPQRPYEASGTSGMKATLNGVPHVSTIDGWWVEGHIENVTGWSIGPHPDDPGYTGDTDGHDEAADLYNKLEQHIIPTFYGDRDDWIRIMKHTIALNASFFNTYRMAEQYISNAYLN